MSEFVKSLVDLNPLWIYAFIFFISYIENIFPPSPSDAVVVLGGAFAAMGRGSFLAALLAGSVGSTLGFMTMYAVGKWFGRSILDAGKLKFISLERVKKLEGWFARYGYWLIVINRFLAGTRAVVSFFAGVAGLDRARTTALSFVSSLAWYGILVYAGYSLGRNWERIGFYLTTYSQVVTGVLVLIAGAATVRYFLRKNRRNGNG